MAKKKMSPSEAAAARRPDDWVSPEAERQAARQVEKAKNVEIGSETMRRAVKDESNRGIFIFFIALFVFMGVIAPFLVAYVSQFLGLA